MKKIAFWVGCGLVCPVVVVGLAVLVWKFVLLAPEAHETVPISIKIMVPLLFVGCGLIVYGDEGK